MNVTRVWRLADVYWLVFDTWGLGMVAGLLSQDGPFAMATTTSTSVTAWRMMINR